MLMWSLVCLGDEQLVFIVTEYEHPLRNCCCNSFKKWSNPNFSFFFFKFPFFDIYIYIFFWLRGSWFWFTWASWILKFGNCCGCGLTDSDADERTRKRDSKKKTMVADEVKSIFGPANLETLLIFGWIRPKIKYMCWKTYYQWTYKYLSLVKCLDLQYWSIIYYFYANLN